MELFMKKKSNRIFGLRCNSIVVKLGGKHDLGLEPDEGYRAQYRYQVPEYIIVECARMCVASYHLSRYIYNVHFVESSKDHTTMTAPLPVCSAELSIVGPR
jgi:hypothetical protein